MGDYNTDISAKLPGLTADPDVTSLALTKEDEFIVLACDGIWDVFSSQGAVDFVRASMRRNRLSPDLYVSAADLEAALGPGSGAGRLPSGGSVPSHRVLRVDLQVS